MKTIRCTINLTYDDTTMHSADKDPDALKWFEEVVLCDKKLTLYSDEEIVDEIGTVKIISHDKIEYTEAA